MTDFSQLLPFIVPFVRDCSDPAATIAARFAAVEFCERTGWLQYEADPITVQEGIASYEIETPEYTLPVHVITASVDGRVLVAKSQEELQAIYGVTDWRTIEGTPVYFTQVTRNEMRLVPSPDADVISGLKLLVTLRPTVDAPEIDDEVYERFGEAIGYGARARLKEMSGQAYFDPAGAATCWDTFRQKISDAVIERRRDMTTTVQHVAMRQF